MTPTIDWKSRIWPGFLPDTVGTATSSSTATTTVAEARSLRRIVTSGAPAGGDRTRLAGTGDGWRYGGRPVAAVSPRSGRIRRLASLLWCASAGIDRPGAVPRRGAETMAKNEVATARRRGCRPSWRSAAPTSSETHRHRPPPKVEHFTPAERAARGKAARAEVPRTSHADWEPSPTRPDPVAILEAQAVSREQSLLPDPLRPDARLAVHLLPRRGGPDGGRPRRAAPGPGSTPSCAATPTS